MTKKLMISILCILLLSLTLVTALFIGIMDYQYEINIKNQLVNNNKIIINLVKNKNIVDLKKMFAESYKNTNLRVTYIAKDGTVILDSQANSFILDNHKNREEVIEAKKYGIGYSTRYSNSLREKMVYCATLFNNGYIIRSAMPTKAIVAFEGTYIQYYFGVLIFIIIFAIFFASKLAEKIVKPIKDLEHTTAKFAKGDLDVRAKISSQDEIGKLSEKFNYMADQLEKTINDAVDKQNKIEAVLKSMDSGVIAVDNNYKIILLNPYAKELFGIKKEVLGCYLLDVIRNHEIESIFKQNYDEYREVKIRWPKERELRIKTTEIINKTKVIGTVAVLHDVTDIKKLENMRSEFVANVSHELKTPLTSIKGFAETLKYVDNSETKEKFLNIINDEAERLTRLISDILTLSDIENETNFRIEKVDINQVIMDAYNLMKKIADDKKININIEGENVPIIDGSSDKLKQMIINLLDNAIKYSEKGNVFVGRKKEKNYCVIWVRDTGIGISEEHLERLFERFYRVDKARERSKGGTGLGLAIVKHIALGHEGTIEVSSKKNFGTEFVVKIPYLHSNFTNE